MCCSRTGTSFIGNLRAEVLLSPGHTLASVTYCIADAAFIHDTFFMPDSGTARADFPGGNAEALWESLQRILSLPADTRLFTGHDYPAGREARWESTVREQRENNPGWSTWINLGLLRKESSGTPRCRTRNSC